MSSRPATEVAIARDQVLKSDVLSVSARISTQSQRPAFSISPCANTANSRLQTGSLGRRRFEGNGAE